MEFNKIICGDCFNILPKLEAKSIDLILTDMPYNMTACDWDKQPIDLNKLWEALKPLGKDNCAYVFTASQPFTSKLVMSNLKMFKYEWVWEKTMPTGIAQSSYMPMKYHENVLVFYKTKPTFNKQMVERSESGKVRAKTPIQSKSHSNHYNLGKQEAKQYNPLLVNPKSVLKIGSVPNTPKGKKLHPTQKPVALMEYLIKTYTNEGDVVLDPFAGSGSTLVACKKLNRRYIGIEISEEYCKIAKDRLNQMPESLF